MDKRCGEAEGHMDPELVSERKSYREGKELQGGAVRRPGATHPSAKEPS